MRGHNLSAWSIKHRVLILFFMLLFLAAGAFAYANLGREEDPTFAVNTMVVSAAWPGATLVDTMNELTNTIEEKLEETPNIDVIKSYTTPGQTVIYVQLLDSTPPSAIPDAWYQVRKKVSDIEQNLPEGTVGPFFNDEYGDVFGIIYGLTFDGYSWREARDFAETAKAAFLSAADTGKVEIFGDQEEKIYLTFSPEQLAAINVSLDQVMNAIAEQNAVTPAGVITTPNEDILIDVSGALTDTSSIAAINLFINGRFYNLTQLATISRVPVDPPTKMYEVNGRPSIGIGISMRAGGNNLTFGDEIGAIAARLQQDFPIGIELVQVSDQPEVVRAAISGFTSALFEAVIIVLAVSFVSLGLRAGLVVALSIPLVLAIVFLFLYSVDISLQRISLGALVIALGLLVDDAMITVESMVSRIEAGDPKPVAASYAYESTAFPMLTGTIVTMAGFLPIGLAQSSVGQYTFSLFAVIAVALTVSWFVAVMFSPVIGVTVLPSTMKAKHAGPGRLMRAFIRVLTVCMRHRYLTVGVTVLLFVLSLFGQTLLQRQFFPASDRPELLVTLILPANSSILATRTEVERIEALIKDDPDVENYSAYIGGGAIRFYLPLDVQGDNDFVAQMVIVNKDLEARDRVEAKLREAIAGMDGFTGRVSRLELGPPVGWPVQYRVTGNTIDEARGFAQQVADVLRSSGATMTVNFDWSEKAKAVRLEINQDRARQLGLSSESIAQQLYAIHSGAVVTELRDNIYLVDVVARATDTDRLSLETLRNLQFNLPTGQAVPLMEIAKLTYELDEAYVWRRDRKPTVTVQADPAAGLQAPTVFKRLRPQIDEIAARMPPGAFIEEGGTVEKSDQSNASVFAQVPLMSAVVLIVLMIQLQSFSRLALVLSVAPLGFIGVVVALLATGTPFGFIALLGVIALTGMIVRNSVILVDRIEYNHEQGLSTWDAVLEATEHRLRPILLTASAAILGMIPIMHDVFWGPMAYAIAGGLAGATLLTLLFLPALYVVWFRVKPPPRDHVPQHLTAGQAPAAATAAAP
ncbi:MAG TPA: efflux RND transporter permease subunit [Bauldia sp.]|nr:efflux RND transporter permease subunit [Bauldia sp.]